MEKKETVLCVFIFLLSAISLIEAFKLEIGSLSNPRAGFFPLVASLGMIFSCFVIIIQAIVSKKVRERESLSAGVNWRRIWGVIALLLLFAFFIERVGYLIICFVFMIVMFRLIEPMKWLHAIMFSGLVAYGSSILLNLFLEAELPRGIIPYGFLGIFY